MTHYDKLLHQEQVQNEMRLMEQNTLLNQNDQMKRIMT